jgi:succinoglycan biosynthesis protein ExoM
MPIVAIGVCTIRRPRMLADCLRSLIRQYAPDAQLRVIVVDNDLFPSAAPVIEQVRRASAIPIHYVHEPRRGIPMARNRLLAEALAQGADWIAMIDDDQTADRDWIRSSLKVVQRDQVDVVRAHREVRYPDPSPFWFVDTRSRPARLLRDGPLEARLLRRLPTSGAVMSARLVKSDGLHLRFDERLALSGQEDGEFFDTAHRHGVRMASSNLPVVTTEKIAARYTYSRYVLHGLAQGSAYAALYRNRRGSARAALHYAAVAPSRIARGLLQLLSCAVLFAISRTRFKKAALEGGRDVMFGIGNLGGLFGWQYQFYGKIDGE